MMVDFDDPVENELMDQKAIISVLFAAVIGLIGWNIKTTNELQLAVQRLEILLLSDGLTK